MRNVICGLALGMLALGLLFGIVTLVVMFSGMPIAFSLGVVAVAFMYVFMPAASLDTSSVDPCDKVMVPLVMFVSGRKFVASTSPGEVTLARLI